MLRHRWLNRLEQAWIVRQTHVIKDMGSTKFPFSLKMLRYHHSFGTAGD
jgi:hypothetical protein